MYTQFQVYAHRNADVPLLREEDLLQALRNESGLECCERANSHHRHFVLGDNDVQLSIRTDLEGNPTSAILEFAQNAEVRIVNTICRTFRALGWKLADVPT